MRGPKIHFAEADKKAVGSTSGREISFSGSVNYAKIIYVDENVMFLGPLIILKVSFGCFCVP